MKLGAALLSTAILATSWLAPASAQQADPNSYAAADIDKILAEHGAYDADEARRIAGEISAAAWRDGLPAIPADATVSITLALGGGMGGPATSTVLWRQPDGRWQWRRSTFDSLAVRMTPPSPQPGQGSAPFDPFANAYTNDGGEVGSVHAYELERQLDSPQRRAEIPFAPAAIPIRGTDEMNICFDGGSTYLIIHRPGETDEVISHACTVRWRNGDLMRLLEGRFGKG